ncbi:MAG TPA: nitrilase-related carbon-nitrogen hydrolase [Phycisphaerales bacterium]|nr:nitrilase-related carbon-nitrogen hydrolase [Phycisphaerales bacterium]
MRAHLVQLDIAWERPEENFRRVEALLGGADIREGDLVLLPEMFATGFSLHTDVTADKHGETLTFLARLAEDLGCYVQGGRTVRDCHCAKAQNRMSVLDPAGSLACEYAKVHPFSFGREPEQFEGGGRVETWAWRSGGQTALVCPAVCYDLRFPELFRIGASRGAEVFALGACWPEARQHHWRALAIARAIENQAFMLAANRTGADPHLRYAGGSIAVDPLGGVIGELGDEEAVLTVSLEMGELRAWRERFPALRDLRLREIG